MKVNLSILFLLFFCACKFSSEQKEQLPVTIDNEPRVYKKQNLSRDNYSLQYYHTWTIDSSDADFDIDSYFTLNAPVENGFATFFIFNTETNEKENVNAQVEAHLKKTMKNAAVTYFDTWGSYKGYGAIMKGKLLGIFKSEIKIFSHSTKTASFIIVSEYEDSEKNIVSPGLELIENSFRLRK